MANHTHAGVTGRLKGAVRRRAEAAVPADFRQHVKASMRESFLAFESLLDEAAKSLDEGPTRRPAKRGRKAH